MVLLRQTATLSQVLTEYVQAKSIKQSSANQLRYSVAKLETWAGRELMARQVTTDLLNEWLAALSGATCSIIAARRNVLLLLRFAADQGWCHEPIARKIRRPPRPKPKPVAWSLEQLRKIRDAADSLPGSFRRHGVAMPVCVYWGCLIRMAYETGLRRGNLFSLRQADVTDAGLIYVRHEKTGEPHLCTIGPQTIVLLRQLPGDEPLRWRDNRSFYRRWKSICLAAGVPYGALHRVRKTAATQVWLDDQENPARVQQFLGHLSPDMWRHYVDRSQGDRRPPQPPEL